MSDEHLFKIDMLTTELERCSQTLQEKAIEAEQWKIKALTIEHHVGDLTKENQMLNQQYISLSERLQQRVIEVEETRSKLMRLQQITMKDCEDKIEKLIAEVERLNAIIESKAFEQESNRQQTIVKIQELQEERQKSYHFENFIKQLKNEKLQALHHLKQKEDQLSAAQKRNTELEEYKVQAQTLQLDIETIRKNYSSLYEQHQQEVQRLNEQIETQRQVNDNNMVIMQRRYTEQLMIEKERWHADHKEAIDTQVVQLENKLQEKQVILEAKGKELDQIRLHRYNEFQEAESMKNLDLTNQLQQLAEKLRRSEQQQQDWRTSAELNHRLIAQGEHQFSQMQMKYKELVSELSMLKRQLQESHELLNQSEINRFHAEDKVKLLLLELARLKEENELMGYRLAEFEAVRQRYANLEVQLSESKQRESTYEQLRGQEIGNKKQEINEADQKIKYLLRLLEQRESQVEELTAKLQYLTPSKPVVISTQKKPPTIRDTIPKSDIVDRRSSVSHNEPPPLSISNIYHGDNDYQPVQGRF